MRKAFGFLSLIAILTVAFTASATVKDTTSTDLIGINIADPQVAPADIVVFDLVEVTVQTFSDTVSVNLVSDVLIVDSVVVKDSDSYDNILQASNRNYSDTVIREDAERSSLKLE